MNTVSSENEVCNPHAGVIWHVNSGNSNITVGENGHLRQRPKLWRIYRRSVKVYKDPGSKKSVLSVSAFTDPQPAVSSISMHISLRNES
jgi:hypothetical protein